MRYMVFEAGGRAALSAELFFLHRANRGDGDSLLLADMDPLYREVPASDGAVVRMTEADAIALLADQEASRDVLIFPADELARQSKRAVQAHASSHPFSAVEPWYFRKRLMNERLADVTSGCTIRIPKTFSTERIFLRPDTMSAGSHGVRGMENTCITELVDVEREYVVDVDWLGDEPAIYPREVRIKHGYDKYIRFLPADGPLGTAVHEFVRAIRAGCAPLTRGIFHLQLIEDRQGHLFFVEYSKRISGTSAVNLVRGFNPFDTLAGAATPVRLDLFAEGTWYRYEDLLLRMHSLRP